MLLTFGFTTTPFNPASPQAQTIYDLFIVTSIILGVILVVVTGLIAYILARFPRADGDAPQTFGSKPLEVAWTAIPILIVLGLTFAQVSTLNTSRPDGENQDPDVVIIGHQWWWEVQYPKAPRLIVTANEVHLPVGKNSLMLLQSADVIHDFWVPELGPKQDMLPGPITVMPSRAVPTGRHQGDTFIWMNPSKPGTFMGTCAEFCGNEHALMRTRVRAEPQEDFDKWELAQSAPETPVAGGDAALGAQVFVQRSCINCHSQPGTQQINMAGPDLSWLADRQTLGCGAIEGNLGSDGALRNWLRDPQAADEKPQCNMPNFHLTEDEIRDLSAYLYRRSTP